MTDDGPTCCTDGDCCGPGSYCCARTGPHTHPELAYGALTEFERGDCAMVNNGHHSCFSCEIGAWAWVDCALDELIRIEAAEDRLALTTAPETDSILP